MQPDNINCKERSVRLSPRDKRFERTVRNPAKVTAVLLQIHTDALSLFKDNCRVGFLDLVPALAAGSWMKSRRTSEFLRNSWWFFRLL